MPEVNLKAFDATDVLVNLSAWETAEGRLKTMVYDEVLYDRIGTISESIPATDSSNGNVIAFLKRIAQNITDQRNDDFIQNSSGSITVTTSLTELVIIDTRRYRVLGFELQNTAATALTQFQIQGRFAGNSSNWFTIADTSTAFTTNSRDTSGNMSRPIIRASGSLITLAGNTNGWALVDCGGFTEVRLRAAVGSGNTSIVVRYNCARY